MKSFATDYGKPKLKDGVVEFFSDEHSTILPTELSDEFAFKVGDVVHLRVPHVDPTIAKHPRLVCLQEGYINGIGRWIFVAGNCNILTTLIQGVPFA